jgi:hypothetical protein
VKTLRLQLQAAAAAVDAAAVDDAQSRPAGVRCLCHFAFL